MKRNKNGVIIIFMIYQSGENKQNNFNNISMHINMFYNISF